MLLRLFLAVIVGALAAGPALAGAWLRETGTGFVSVTQRVLRDGSGPRGETSIYGEYGFRDDLTLGMDINIDRTRQAWHLLSFSRIPLAQGKGGGRIATEMAAGVYRNGPFYGTLFRLILSAGRPLVTRAGAGWVNLDAGVELRPRNAAPNLKLDATFGLNPAAGLRPIIQLQSVWNRDSGLNWTLLPGLSFQPRSGMVWTIALEYRSPPAGGRGIQFAIWQKF